MYVSDLVVNTDSCSVKEAIMLGKKVINIKSKTYDVMNDLYEKNAKEKYLWNFNSSEAIYKHIMQFL